MAQRRGREGQVKEITDDDVDENAEVVGVKVFAGLGGGEEEVEDFEDQKLQRRFACKGDVRHVVKMVEGRLYFRD